MPKYIAKQSIGHFMPGDEIKGLDADRIQALLVSGAIQEDVPIKFPEQQPDPLLAKLEKENVELKTEVANLKKALAAAEKKLKTDTEAK